MGKSEISLVGTLLISSLLASSVASFAKSEHMPPIGLAEQFMCCVEFPRSKSAIARTGCRNDEPKDWISLLTDLFF